MGFKGNFYALPFLSLNLIFAVNLLPFSLFKFSFLIPLVLFAGIFRISGKWIVFSLFLSLVLWSVCYLVEYLGLRIHGTYFSVFLNRVFPLHKWIVEYTSSVYSPTVFNVINLLVFNVKERSLYKGFIELGIPYLVSISGIHFLLLKRLIMGFVKNKFLFLTIMFFYWSATNYSIPALRVLIGLASPKNMNPLKKWSLSVLLSIFFNLHIYCSLSFLLSYFLSAIVIFNGCCFVSRFSNVVANLVLPFVFSSLIFLSYEPHKIYPLSIINGIIFFPIILGSFLWFFLGWCLTFLNPIHEIIANIVVSLRDLFQVNTFYISLPWWNHGFTCLSLALFGTLIIIFWHRWYSFTTQKIGAY